MKFIINTTNLQNGGALQVACSLLNEWNKHCATYEFHICLSPQLAKTCANIQFNKHINIYIFEQHSTNKFIKLIRNRQRLKQIEASTKPDAVLTIFGPALWQPKVPHIVGFANGYYLFDRAQYIQEKICTDFLKRIYYYSRRWLMLQQLKKEAQQFWVETAQAQEQFSKAISVPLNKIQVIGNCASILGQTISPKHRNQNTYRLLYLSAFYEHKNFSIIPFVIDELKKRGILCQFCVTLPDAAFQSIFGHVKNSNYLLNLGPIASMEIGQAYADADAVFMPSLLETFSANYPEAMYMRKPILCSDYAFSRSICQDAALYFNPFDAHDIADKINILMQDKLVQANLIAAGSRLVIQMETPESRAKKLVQQLVQLAANTNKTDTSCVA
jgi:glycosyltransferase involved in cell wall biosynthesis